MFNKNDQPVIKYGKRNCFCSFHPVNHLLLNYPVLMSETTHSYTAIIVEDNDVDGLYIIRDLAKSIDCTISVNSEAGKVTVFMLEV